MSSQELILTVISSAGLASLVSAFLIFLMKNYVSEKIKNAIKAEYDAKLEAYKAKLSYEASVELEKLKSTLAITAIERNATFTELHTRRVDAIADTYSSLMKLYISVQDYIKIFEVTGGITRKERRENVYKASCDFTPILHKNKIFLTKKIAELIESANSELIKVANQFAFEVDNTNQPSAKAWVTLTKKMDSDFKSALEELEAEMRECLGDES